MYRCCYGSGRRVRASTQNDGLTRWFLSLSMCEAIRRRCRASRRMRSEKALGRLPPWGRLIPRFRPLVPPPSPDHHTVRVVVHRLQLQFPIVRIERPMAQQQVGFMILRPEKRIDRFAVRFSSGLADLRDGVDDPSLPVRIKCVDRGEKRVYLRDNRLKPVVIPLP